VASLNSELCHYCVPSEGERHVHPLHFQFLRIGSEANILHYSKVSGQGRTLRLLNVIRVYIIFSLERPMSARYAVLGMIYLTSRPPQVLRKLEWHAY
jgi:hypothetical protein